MTKKVIEHIDQCAIFEDTSSNYFSKTLCTKMVWLSWGHQRSAIKCNCYNGIFQLADILLFGTGWHTGC